MAKGRNHTANQAWAWNALDSASLALVAGLTFACYAPALGYDFVYDDRLLILKNPQLLSWRWVPHFFCEHFVAAVFPGAPANYYRPVLLLWMLINQKLWGLTPFGWHLTAIVLHLLVTAEVYLVARRLLGDPFSAALAGAIFGLHPVHVECVAWVMGMAEPFGALCLIASLLCYFRGFENPDRRFAWHGASLAFFALAVLIKENMLVLPGLILTHHWLYSMVSAGDSRSGEYSKRLWVSFGRAAPWFGVAAIYFALRVLVLRGLLHAAMPIPLRVLLATWPLVLWEYFRRLVWPVRLSVLYDVPYVSHMDLKHFLLPLAGIVSIAVGLAWWGRKSRPAAFAAAWMALPILPLLSLAVFPEGEIVHDRYLYLSSVGFALLAALGLGRPSERPLRIRQRPVWQWGLALALVMGLGFGTRFYGRFWANNLVLYERAVAMAPENKIAANNLADELVDRGEYREAMNFYRRVLGRDPGYWLALYNLGYCSYKLGELSAAEQYFDQAIKIDPQESDQYVYLGLTRLKMGQTELAETALRYAIQLKPEGAGYHLALGVVLRQRGAFEAALKEFRTELAYHPGEPATEQEIEAIQPLLRKASPPASPAH